MLKLYGWLRIGTQIRKPRLSMELSKQNSYTRQGLREPHFQYQRTSNEVLKCIIGYGDTAIGLEVHMSSIFLSLPLNNGNERHKLRKLVLGPKGRI